MNTEREQQLVLEILNRWSSQFAGPNVVSPILRRLSVLLKRTPYEDIWGNIDPASPYLNAQISVDTGQPEILRLLIDPFAGESFSSVGDVRLRTLLGLLPSEALTERVIRLYKLGYALPPTLWIGAAAFDSTCVIKAYIASPDPIIRPFLPELAWNAGWLPVTMDKTFTSFYERLTPSLAVLEGIGISFIKNTWIETTFYLRSAIPWTWCVTERFAEYIGVRPLNCFTRLNDIFVGQRVIPTFGWSLKCDVAGRLVDVKLEYTVDSYSTGPIEGYAREFGINISPVSKLRKTITHVGLSGDRSATPSIMSLRFSEGQLKSMVAYFQLCAIP